MMNANIVEIAKLELKRGDILAIKAPDDVSMEDIEQLSDWFINEGIRVIVHNSHVELTVITKEDSK